MTHRGTLPNSGPPSLATRLLGLLLTEEDREPVAEELEELYGIQCARKGAAEARWWYRRQVAVFAWHLLRYGRRRGRVAAAGGLRLNPTGWGGKRGGVWEMTKLLSELRQSFRRLRRAPAFTTVSVLTLGIGIGAFTSIFGLVESVLLEPMPYDEPEELVWVWRDYTWASFPRGWLGGPDIVNLRDQSDVFEGVVGFQSGTLNLTGPDLTEPRQIRVLSASHEFFSLLGIEPFLGRGFLAEEDSPDAGQSVVLGYALWRGQFGGDPGVLGRTILLDGESSTVVGVAPESFHFVKHGSGADPAPADIYVNLRVDLGQQSVGDGSYAGLARLRPEVHPEQLEAALAAAARPLDDLMGNRGLRLWSVGLKEDLIGGIRPALVALIGSATFLLLILSANLATLLLGRAAVREQELGIRVALGAGKGWIFTSVSTESLVLGVMGGALGVFLAVLGTDLVVALAPENLPRLAEVGLDLSILAVALLVTAVISVAAGLTPALFARRTSLVAMLKEGGIRSGGSLRGARMRSTLVAAQVALSMMLLVGGGLTAQAFASLLRADPGFDPGQTLTFRVPLSRPEGSGRDVALAFHGALRTRLSVLPGVTAAGATNAIPLTQTTNQNGIGFPGAPGNTGEEDVDRPLIDYFRVTPDYFRAAGFRIMAGRPFRPADADTASFPLIIDDVLADRFFPDGSAVGSLATFRQGTATIVGVVDQARHYDVHSDHRGQAYIPFERFPTWDMAYAVRTELEPASLVAAVRGAIEALDASVPMSDVRPLDVIVTDSLGQQRLSVTLILSFALGSLLLAMLGIYGVVANSVVRRTQEIGVRIALGAGRERVLSMVLGQGLRLTVVGVVVGLGGALATSRILEGVMFGLQARNPFVYLGVAAGLVAVAAVAAYLPARRATRIDPVEALRPE